MLYKSTVSKSTFELLKLLQAKPEFSKLRLVGDTALALQMGHRISVELDFFGEVEFEHIYNKNLFQDFDSVQWIKKSKNINILEINGVKVDYVNYQYPWLEEVLTVDTIKMASIKDIAAMKVAAITGRGSKKDFVDLFFLLKHFTFEEILGFYSQKYTDASIYLALKSLAYFDDADQEPSLNMLIKTDWADVKNRISEELIRYANNIKS